jgi:hypothetical protein
MIKINIHPQYYSLSIIQIRFLNVLSSANIEIKPTGCKCSNPSLCCTLGPLPIALPSTFLSTFTLHPTTAHQKEEQELPETLQSTVIFCFATDMYCLCTHIFLISSRPSAPPRLPPSLPYSPHPSRNVLLLRFLLYEFFFLLLLLSSLPFIFQRGDMVFKYIVIFCSNYRIHVN